MGKGAGKGFLLLPASLAGGVTHGGWQEKDGINGWQMRDVEITVRPFANEVPLRALTIPNLDARHGEGRTGRRGEGEVTQIKSKPAVQVASEEYHRQTQLGYHFPFVFVLLRWGGRGRLRERAKGGCFDYVEDR